jgi:hypothetical protein
VEIALFVKKKNPNENYFLCRFKQQRGEESSQSIRYSEPNTLRENEL